MKNSNPLCRCKPKTNNSRSRKCRSASKLKNSLVECLKDPQVKNTKTLQLLKSQTETLLSKKRKKILIVVDRSVSIEMLAAGNKWRLMLTTSSKEKWSDAKNTKLGRKDQAQPPTTPSTMCMSNQNADKCLKTLKSIEISEVPSENAP